MHRKGVVLTDGEPDQQTLTGMLFPYYSGLEVPEYDEGCECVSGDGVADPDCLDCSGTGLCKSTWNKQGRWDYFQYVNPHQVLDPVRDDVEWSFNPVFPTVPVTELVERQRAFPVVVTPDGAWHEDERTFPDRPVPADAWREAVMGLYRAYPNCVATVIDFHR